MKQRQFLSHGGTERCQIASSACRTLYTKSQIVTVGISCTCGKFTECYSKISTEKNGLQGVRDPAKFYRYKLRETHNGSVTDQTHDSIGGKWCVQRKQDTEPIQFPPLWVDSDRCIPRQSVERDEQTYGIKLCPWFVCTRLQLSVFRNGQIEQGRGSRHQSFGFR